MTTGAFSRNVGKLFFKLKLVTDNLLFIYAIHWSTHTHTIVTRLWLQPWWSNHARLDWLTFGVSECWALKLSTRYYMNRNWRRILLTVVTSATSKVQQRTAACNTVWVDPIWVKRLFMGICLAACSYLVMIWQNKVVLLKKSYECWSLLNMLWASLSEPPNYIVCVRVLPCWLGLTIYHNL